jgi:mannose-6-phosphate isomerase-like protein (cupin superfamily)
VTESFENAHSGAQLMLEEPGHGVLAYVRLMPPGTGRAVAHVHLNFDQRFTVLSGHAHYQADGRPGALAPGEEIFLPRGSPHIDPYPEGNELLTLRNVGQPEMPGARDYATPRAWSGGVAVDARRTAAKQS